MDDCSFFAKNQADIDVLIVDLKQDFDLEVEEDVYAFLGVEVTKDEHGKVTLKQLGLIQKVLDTTGMLDARLQETPANVTLLGTEAHGTECKEV